MRDDIFSASSKAGLYQFLTEDFSQLAPRAGAENIQTIRADLSNCRNKHALLEQLGRDLNFPDWFGANWDALHECLTDLDGHGMGTLILLSGLGTLQDSDPESLSTLIEVLSSATNTRKDLGVPFWIVVDTPIPGLPLLS